jgi:Response regulators consisting of a CheY-like receiver domain and a winged-helix DNA-binding domain
MTRVLVIDDERAVLESVTMLLEDEGYKVSAYADPRSAVANFARTAPDIVVLDLKMPGLTGFEVLRKIRAQSGVPVVFLTSRDDEIDEVEGLRQGADDYLTKPYSSHLLLARLEAILRRSQPPRSDQLLSYKGLEIDEQAMVCRWHGERVSLTVTECLIMICLARRPGQVLSREQLIHDAYENDDYTDPRAVDSHIKRIRRKFRAIDSGFDGITSLYGVGYRLDLA